MSRNGHNSYKKLGLERAMNELGKPFRKKKSDPKNRKNSKNQSKIATFERKKPLERKQIFVRTPFSHSTYKFEQN